MCINKFNQRLHCPFAPLFHCGDRNNGIESPLWAKIPKQFFFVRPKNEDDGPNDEITEKRCRTRRVYKSLASDDSIAATHEKKSEPGRIKGARQVNRYIYLWRSVRVESANEIDCCRILVKQHFVKRNVSKIYVVISVVVVFETICSRAYHLCF